MTTTLPLGATPPLETERLNLIQPCENTIDAIVANINDIDVAGRLSNVPYPYGRDDGRFYIHQVVPRHMVWGILTKRFDAIFVGTIGLHSERSDLLLGYWLGKAHWGQGYASEAGKAVCNFAFGELKMPRLLSQYHSDNPASGHVLSKLGFKPTHRGTFFSVANNFEMETVFMELDAKSWN